jgi:hypothetical protein
VLDLKIILQIALKTHSYGIIVSDNHPHNVYKALLGCRPNAFIKTSPTILLKVAPIAQLINCVSNDYIAKPINKDELLSRIQKYFTN